MNDDTSADKAKSKSVSMPPELWRAVDNFVSSVHHDRSSWLRMLATRELAAANALPADPVTIELARVRELIDVQGLAAVRQKLDELTLAAVGEEAAS